MDRIIFRVVERTLIFRHEDGSIRFWDVSGVVFHLIYSIYTSRLFLSDIEYGPPHEEFTEEWPFKKVGQFDPYSDDSRFAFVY